MEINNKFIKKCDLCKNNATNLCFQCKHNYCEGCKKFIHDLKENSGHKIENIDPYIPIDLKCPEHPENALNLFCVDEKGK